MQFGISLPNFLDGDDLCRIAAQADILGFESVWAGDHIVLASEESYQYPYSTDGRFVMEPDTPHLEMMTLLSYVASHTKQIRIGSTVIILPYRNPILQAKMFASLDVLTKGRVICGVGVGWLEKEFEALGASYAERGPMSSEYLEIFKCLWTERNPEYHGHFYSFDGIQLYPKPVQKPHIPIWVGGHSRRAIRRAVTHGDAWHPSRQTPEYVSLQLPYLHRIADELGRDPSEMVISLKRSLHFTDIGVVEREGVRPTAALVDTTQHVIDDARRCQELGIHQLTYDFRTVNVDQYLHVIEHLAEKVVRVV